MPHHVDTGRSRRRLPAIAAGVVLGAAPVTGLVAVGMLGDWTMVGGGETVELDGSDGSPDDRLGDPAAIAVPLPEPATLADAPRPPAIDPPAVRDGGAEVVPPTSDDRWYTASPASRSLVPAIVPMDLRDEVDVIPASVRIAGVDDVTISFRTESGLTGHAVGAGSIDDTVVPLFFLADRDRTIRVVASSVRGESVVAAIPLAEVVGTGGLDVSGPDLASIDVRSLSASEMAHRLGVTVDGLDDYRLRQLRL